MCSLREFPMPDPSMLRPRPLETPALLVQHPRAPVVFDRPTSDQIAAAKAWQVEQRIKAGVCVECGSTRERHYDASGVILLGCPELRGV